MSLIKIRAALETALNGMSPALATAWENVPFTPVSGSPYQQAFVDPGQPDNPEYGPGYQQSGIFQINLRYPLQNGPIAAATRAELIQTTFKRGTTFVNSGVTVTVTNTPAIGKGVAVDDRWFIPVRVFFHANIFN